MIKRRGLLGFGVAGQILLLISFTVAISVILSEDVFAQSYSEIPTGYDNLGQPIFGSGSQAAITAAPAPGGAGNNLRWLPDRFYDSPPADSLAEGAPVPELSKIDGFEITQKGTFTLKGVLASGGGAF